MGRKWLISTLCSAVLVLAGAWPYPGWRVRFAELYSASVNTLLWHDIEFGDGGRAKLVALSDADKPSTVSVTQDAALELRIDGRPDKASLGVNLRREIYLPWLIFVAFIVPAPFDRRRKAWCLLIGLPLMVLLTTLALEGVIVWFFTFQAGDAKIFDPQSMQASVIDWVLTRILTPPSHRYLLPILLAWILLTYPWQRQGAKVTKSAIG